MRYSSKVSKMVYGGDYNPEQWPEDDLMKYEIVIAPVFYMTPKDYDQKIRCYVRKGGTFLTTFFQRHCR